MKRKLTILLAGLAVFAWSLTPVLLFTSLRNTQREQKTLAQESTATRVHTVAQRCELTALIRHVLVAQDPTFVGAFNASYEKCTAQLGEVEAINARAHGH